jgi:hypothetical protein
VKSQPSVDAWLLCLPGPYHRHAISTFNTCSRGPSHRSLNDTGGGYYLGGADIPYLTPRPSQLTVLQFPPKSPHGFRLYSLNISSSESDVKHLSPTCGLSTTQRLPKPISTPRNGQHHPSTIKVIKGNSEGIHNATTVPINSYQPNAQSFLT